MWLMTNSMYIFTILNIIDIFIYSIQLYIYIFTYHTYLKIYTCMYNYLDPPNDCAKLRLASQNVSIIVFLDMTSLCSNRILRSCLLCGQGFSMERYHSTDYLMHRQQSQQREDHETSHFGKSARGNVKNDNWLNGWKTQYDLETTI